jgi:hypothetical protein
MAVSVNKTLNRAGVQLLCRSHFTAAEIVGFVMTPVKWPVSGKTDLLSAIFFVIAR